MKTIEDVARYLLEHQLSFNYNNEFLFVTSTGWEVFRTASLEEDKLVLRHRFGEEVSIEQLTKQL